MPTAQYSPTCELSGEALHTTGPAHSIKLNYGHRNSIQLSNLCLMCRKKAFLNSVSISDEIISKFGVRGTPEYQRVTSKGPRTMGSEWPDKPDKRDETGFDSVARGDGNFFRVVILHSQLNSVGYRGWGGGWGWRLLYMLLHFDPPFSGLLKICIVSTPSYIHRAIF